jgi:hypothetical protein
MGHVESEQSFEDLPEQGTDKGGHESGFCVNLHLGNKLIEREKKEERQDERYEVLEKKIVDERHGFWIDVVGNERAFLDDPVDSCPDRGDRERDQQDDPYDKQKDVFHDPAVEKGLLLVGFEDTVYGCDHVREQKAGRDERPCQAEPSKIGDVLGEVLESIKKGGIELGEELIVENIQAAEGDLRVSENACRDKCK